jgi:hypothetical protein
MLLGIYVSCSNRARRLCLIEHRFTPRPLSQRMHRFTRFTTRQSPSAPFASCNGLSFGAASPLAYAKTRRHWSPSATFATAATIAACVRLLSRRPHLTCRSSGRPSAAAYLYVRCQCSSACTSFAATERGACALPSIGSPLGRCLGARCGSPGSPRASHRRCPSPLAAA